MTYELVATGIFAAILVGTVGMIFYVIDRSLPRPKEALAPRKSKGFRGQRDIH